jgi:hypothetical protein
MRKHTWHVFALLACAHGAAFGAEFKGVLVDAESAWLREAYVTADGRLAGGMLSIYAITREQALSPAAQKAGYGLVTEDRKFLKFDTAGNQKAIAALKLSKRANDLQCVVTGELKGETLAVATVRIQP